MFPEPLIISRTPRVSVRVRASTIGLSPTKNLVGAGIALDDSFLESLDSSVPANTR